MEKNENEELLEQSPAEIQQEDTPEIAKSGEEEPDTEEQKVSNGRFILWSLAGVYLLYTSYSLCKGYVTGEEGTSMGFMLAGIAFAAIGAGLLFFGIKNMLSEEKIKKAKAAKNAAIKNQNIFTAYHTDRHSRPLLLAARKRIGMMGTVVIDT